MILKPNIQLSNILITGASGFIGSNFFDYLKDKNHNCFGYSRNGSNIKHNKVDNYHSLIDFNHDDELVVHLAGSNSSEAITDLKNEFNVTKELSLHFKNRFIYISSAKVYSITSSRPLKETDVTTSHNEYNKLKLMCENEVIKNRGMVLRLSNVYGDGMSYKNVFSHIKAQIAQNKNEIQLKRPDDTNDFINIEDLCEALYLSCQKPMSKIFNVGSGSGVTIRELSRLIAYEYGVKDISIKTLENNYQPITTILCCDLFKKNYDWKPKIKINLGIKNWLN